MAKFNPVHKSAFRKDVIRCGKRGCDIPALELVMEKLENGEPLDPIKNRPHWLSGHNPRVMECHIEGDWLLEYRFDGNDIYYIRTGTHSDLFG
jgi:mRNA interferase YafQ